MKTTLEPQLRQPHELDDIDRKAHEEAETFITQQYQEIIADRTESAMILFEMMADTYRDRTVYQRMHYGDEIIDSTYIPTRTPDMTAIDELYATHTVYDMSSDNKIPKTSVERSATLYDGEGRYRRLLIKEDVLRAVNHKGEELSDIETTETVMDFVFRTQQAIATYKMRSPEEQAAANQDAKDKLRTLGIS